MDSPINTSNPLIFIQLGRIGDLLILLPCWKIIAERTGTNPVVVVAKDFADVLKGVSYVTPDVVLAHWYASMQQAILMAKLKYGAGNFVVTQCHGLGHETDTTKYPTFGHAMRHKAGFPGPYESLPLVFDRRNPQREQKLLDRVAWGRGKPLLLYNFRGTSSPLPAGQAIRHRLRKYERDFTLVNLGQVRAERFYDLLALYDIAAGLITIDTSTLHLAAASPVPMLAYCRGGWSSAIPKAGAVSVEYKNAELRLDVVDGFVESIRK